MERYVVAYAKIITDKNSGISLAGVFFGGLGETSEEADQLARECVNNIRGGTILPRVMPIIGEGQLLEAMFDATDKFEEITSYMIEANDTIVRTQKMKNK